MSAWQRATRLGCVLLVLAWAVHCAHAADLALSVDLDPAGRRLSASAELVAPGPFAFHLHPTLSVHSVTVDGRRETAAQGPRGQWRVPAAKGAKLRIEYGGTLPALESLDHRAVLQNATPMASAKGTFLPGSSGWYPQPAVPFAYSVRITLPADQRGLVAGTLMKETLPVSPADRYVADFSFAHPAEDIDLMAGPYVIRERMLRRPGAAPVRLRTYFHADLDVLAEGYIESSAVWIEQYSQTIGGYLFDSFSVVASPLPTGFGMPTLTYLGAEVLKLPFIRAISLRHEVLHNWWGNGVRVDYARGNWSEGLTTLMADYAGRQNQSAQAAREMRLSWLRDFAAIPDGADVPLSQFRSRTHGAEAAVGYGTSAMLFLMVRDMIGIPAFTSALQSFYSAHRFRAASWSDLRTAFERTSGRKLDEYFAQWLERRGGPQLGVREARLRTSAGTNVLTLTMTQSAPAYVLEVPVEISDGLTTEIRSVRVDREVQDVAIESSFAPKRVRIDPDVRLWRRLDASELSPILRQWIIATKPRVTVVSQAVEGAAREVAKAFFENTPAIVSLGTARSARDPLLIVGLHDDVDAALAKLGLSERPYAPARRGSAQAWTITGGGDTSPLAVLSAQDAESLHATARALPHLGAQSWLVFEGARVIDRGVWPAAGRAVNVVRVP